MKIRILEILKESSEIVSGEKLSSRLKVSRVTVWKHIKALQELGYDISAGAKGYSIQGDNDFLYPWEFGQRSSRIQYHESLSSTMDTARELARQGAKDQSVVIAEIQKNGRGRMHRKWHSERGGLYFTLTLRPQIPAASGFLMNFVVSTLLAETIRDYTGLQAMVKWPNDILIGEKKLSGMISEMEAEADMVTFINIGIGLNVNNDPGPIEPKATSISREIGKKHSRRALLTLFLDKLSKKMMRLDLDTAVRDWKQYTVTLGRDVKIVTTQETVEGKVIDVEDSGALLLQLPDGTEKKVIYGDCFHV